MILKDNKRIILNIKGLAKGLFIFLWKMKYIAGKITTIRLPFHFKIMNNLQIFIGKKYLIILMVDFIIFSCVSR